MFINTRMERISILRSMRYDNFIEYLPAALPFTPPDLFRWRAPREYFWRYFEF